MKFKNLPNIFALLKTAAIDLRRNDPLRLGAATAFFTIFALPFILIFLINLFGFIFSQEIVSGEIFALLRRHIGTDSAGQVQRILENFQKSVNDPIYVTLGTIFLLFVSTTLFIVIQNSINQLWHIKHKAHHQIQRAAKDRAISLGIIIFSGIIFLAAVLSDVLLAFLGDLLHELEPTLDIFVIQIANKIVSILLTTIWFAILFRYLPNARIKWSAIWWGAALTSVLFAIGEFILGKVLIEGNLGSFYGAAGSIVLVLLFVFYSSIILYFGASFIKAYATEMEMEIEPKVYASKYKIEEIE